METDLVSLGERDERVRQTVTLLGALVVCLGIAVLAGWAGDVTALRQVVPGWIDMQPLTALAFVLTGVALLLGQAGRRGLQALAVTATCVIAGNVLLEYWTAGPSFADTLLFHDAVMREGLPEPGRMAQLTAAEFLLAGLCLVAAGSEDLRGVFVVGSCFGIILAVLVLGGYLFQARLAAPTVNAAQAIHTVVGLLVVFLALSLYRPHWGWMALLLSPGPGGTTARRLLPVIALLPPACGLAVQLLMAFGSGPYLQAGLQIGLAVTLVMVALCAIVVRLAARLDALDAERRAVIARLRRSQAELRDSLERRGMLELQLLHATRVSTMGEAVAGLAHELNQPLLAVGNYIEACDVLLRSGKPDSAEKILKGLAEAHGQSLRAVHILRRLRRFIRKEAQGPRRLADLNALVREAAALALPQAEHEGIALHWDLAAHLPPVEVDPIQIQQVVVNLARNAVDAMQGSARRELSIATGLAAEGEMLTMSDSGPGIPEGAAERLFHPFHTTKPSGLGLGLSICRSIVEAHGGRIWAESGRGGGAVFKMSLPRAPAERAHAA